jgi:hypothetical protein
MHKFSYRSPRYVVDFPVELVHDNVVMEGRCREISSDGMQLELRRPLPQDFCGLVCLTWQDIEVELHVRLAHSGSRQDALRFVFESEKERMAVADLIARLAEPAEQSGLALVPQNGLLRIRG